jgi:hypothetical protein
MSLMDRLRALFGDRKCRDCDGRGKWQTEFTGADGITSVDTFYCETCHGKGFITNDEDTDDFDLGGVGVTESDNDDE